jgi:hypothetical protein
MKTKRTKLHKTSPHNSEQRDLDNLVDKKLMADSSLLDLERLESISTQIAEKKRKPVEASDLINELLK